MTSALFISSFSMDEKEAEARPVMGTIFLVMLSVCRSMSVVQRIHVPFESLTFSVARELKLRDGFH